MNLLQSKRSSEATCVLHWKTLNFLFKVCASYMLIERSTDSWLVWFNALGLQILKCHYDYTGSVQWHLLNKIVLRRKKSCFSYLLFSLIFFLMLGWNNIILKKTPKILYNCNQSQNPRIPWAGRDMQCSRSNWGSAVSPPARKGSLLQFCAPWAVSRDSPLSVWLGGAVCTGHAADPGGATWDLHPIQHWP